MSETEQQMTMPVWEEPDDLADQLRKAATAAGPDHYVMVPRNLLHHTADQIHVARVEHRALRTKLTQGWMLAQTLVNELGE